MRQRTDWQFRVEVDVLDQAVDENLKALDSLVLFVRREEPTGAIRYDLRGRHSLDPTAVHGLMADIISEGVQATVSSTIREMEEAMAKAVASLKAVGSSEVGHIRLRTLPGGITEMQVHGPKRSPKRGLTPEERVFTKEAKDTKEHHRRIVEISKRITGEVEEDYRRRLKYHRTAMSALFNRLRKDGPIGGPYLWPAKAYREAPATQVEPSEAVGPQPYVPKQARAKERYKTIWGLLKSQARRGTTYREMTGWLKSIHPELTVRYHTVRRICRAGMAGLLE